MANSDQDTFTAYQDRANRYLQRFQEQPLGHFIAGRWCPTDAAALFDNINPADNTSLGQVVAGTPEDMAEACEAAAEAFPAWAAMNGAKRRTLLHHFADLIQQRADEIALVESSDCGQAIRFMKQAAIRGAANFRFFADKAPEARNGLSLFQPDHTNYTLRTKCCNNTCDITNNIAPHKRNSFTKSDLHNYPKREQGQACLSKFLHVSYHLVNHIILLK